MSCLVLQEEIPEIDVKQSIQVKNIGMTFKNGKNKETVAIKDISIDIKEGEFVSLLGPSGCGKTTLLRIMADLLEPTSGSVEIFGQTPREIRVQHKYGIVFQNPVLYDWRTVRKNICLPLEIIKTDKKEQRERSDRLLNVIGLGKYANHYPHQLSGGMQQRVGIARALATRPKILLMDEPFSALDEFTREKLNEDLLRIWGKFNNTVVFVTHNIAESVFLSDRVYVLSPHPGRLSAAIEIDLPRPRVNEMRYTKKFQDLVEKIRNSFEGV